VELFLRSTLGRVVLYALAYDVLILTLHYACG
jgi:hypothetical protein